MRLPVPHPLLEGLRLGQKAGANEEQRFVVGGEPFESPEVRGVDLAGVVERAEGLGPDALDVPGVEELVRKEEERVAVGLFGPERMGIERDRLGGAMLEPSARACGEVNEEEVTLVRQAAEERRGFEHEPLEVPREARGVLVAAAPERERMRHAAHGESERAVRPAFERQIHELVVVGRAKDAAARR